MGGRGGIKWVSPGRSGRANWTDQTAAQIGRTDRLDGRTNQTGRMDGQAGRTNGVDGRADGMTEGQIGQTNWIDERTDCPYGLSGRMERIWRMGWTDERHILANMFERNREPS